MDDNGDRVDAADLRVSDAEREHVLRLLQEALARGMLDAAEFDDRSSKVVQSRVRRDLNVLVADLAVQYGSGSPTGRAGAPDSVQLNGSFSSLRREGGWVVPRRIVLRHQWGSVHLDFTEAQLRHSVVDLDVNTIGSSIRLWLPDGASVSLDDIEMVGGGAHDRRPRRANRDSGPHFVVAGKVHWGSVSVRGPRHGVLGRR